MYAPLIGTARNLALALGLWMSALVPQAQAQGGPSAEIEGVISRQIEAFRADDFDTAFTFASPSIQMFFRTPDNFGAMVRRGYPMVWRPADLNYGPLREEAGVLWKRVIVRDQQGAVHVLEYRMEQLDGAWRIAGVRFVPAPDVAA